MAEPSSAADAAGGSSAAQKAPPTSNNKQQQQYAQMKKLADANTKYKSLIKLAKERIQAQDEELETLRGEWVLICTRI
jgi:sulfur transfer protein SufE